MDTQANKKVLNKLQKRKVGTELKPLKPFNITNSKSVNAPLVPSNFKKKGAKVDVKPPTK